MTNDPTGFLSDAMKRFKVHDRDGAAAAIRRLIDAHPPIGQTWGAVSRMADVMGEIDSAISATRLRADVSPLDAPASLELGRALARYGRHAEAIRVGEALQAEQPANPAAWHFTGVCRSETGDMAGAERDLRRALGLSTDLMSLAVIWQTLAGLKRFERGDPDLVAIPALLARVETSPPAKGVLLYAWGKALDDLGETERAFAAYAEGASLIRKPGSSLTRISATVDEIVRDFDAGALADLSGKGLDDQRPLFVMGMPRSGTTLVEQMLVSHPDVAAGAELGLFQAAAMPVLGATVSATRTFTLARPEGLRNVGRSYLAMLDQRFGQAGRIVDKTLNQARYVGLIHAVLPQARFIWVRRSPGAVAWSCFRTRFAGALDWSWSLEDIAAYMMLEDRLHAHWSALLPDAILSVDYEDLVRDPQTQAHRLCDHARLPWNEAVLSPHLTERSVPSASFAQVRQPIHERSIESWRRYETHLQPFFDAYRAS